jgi:alpha-tubulin suppressor-like RCC1 family protein
MALPEGATPKSVAASSYHTFVVTEEGALLACGYNGYGEPAEYWSHQPRAASSCLCPVASLASPRLTRPHGHRDR